VPDRNLNFSRRWPPWCYLRKRTSFEVVVASRDVGSGGSCTGSGPNEIDDEGEDVAHAEKATIGGGPGIQASSPSPATWVRAAQPEADG